MHTFLSLNTLFGFQGEGGRGRGGLAGRQREREEREKRERASTWAAVSESWFPSYVTLSFFKCVCEVKIVP